MRRVRLGNCEVSHELRRLWIDGQPARIGSRAFDLLCALIATRERVASKDELLQMVWPGRIVEENNLSVQVAHLRRVLGREALVTVAGRGYQLAWPVEDLAPAPRPGATLPATAWPFAAPAPAARLPDAATAAAARPAAPGTAGHPGDAAMPGGVGPWSTREALSPASARFDAEPEGGAAWMVLRAMPGEGAPAAADALASAGAERALAAGADGAAAGPAAGGTVPGGEGEAAGWLDGPDGAALARQLAAHGGHRLPWRGGGLLLWFGDVRRAVVAARAWLQRPAGAEPRPWAVGLHHAGPQPVAGSASPADTAARLATVAGAGGLVLSQAAAAQLIPAVDGELLDLGRHPLPGGGSVRALCLVPNARTPGDALGAAPASAWVRGRAGTALPAGFGPGERPATPDEAQRPPLLAVLPPRPVGAADAEGARGEVVADHLAMALARSSSRGVVSRLSTCGLRPALLGPVEAGRLLGAQQVLSGRYRAVGPGVWRFDWELVDTRDGRVAWALSVAETESDLLQPGGNLASACLQGVGVALYGQPLPVPQRRALPDVAAHARLLRAVEQLHQQSAAGFDQAHQRLVALQRQMPGHPAPPAWLAHWHLRRLAGGSAEDGAVDLRQAREAAERALLLAPMCTVALSARAQLQLLSGAEPQQVLAALDRALECNPNDARAWTAQAQARLQAGDAGGALLSIERVMWLSPLDPQRHQHLQLMATAALQVGDAGRAITAARSALRLQPDLAAALQLLVIALAQAGALEEARLAARDLQRLRPGITIADCLAATPVARTDAGEGFAEALARVGLPAGADSAH